MAAVVIVRDSLKILLVAYNNLKTVVFYISPIHIKSMKSPNRLNVIKISINNKYRYDVRSESSSYLLNGRSGHRSRQPQDPFSCVQQPENRCVLHFPDPY